ncbi:MAG: phosphatidate cytidylyltransferase [Oscillospiraceae bacterium]|nr:phosphatidate cytidylyltransferase [Oscillospiraceae bacterium]
MLTRIISAAVGIVIAIVVLILHDTFVLNLAIGLISAVMVYELLNAVRCFKIYILSFPSMLYAVLLPFLVRTEYVFLASFVYVILAFSGTIFQHKHIKAVKTLVTIACTLLVSNAMSTLIQLYDYGELQMMAAEKASGVLGLVYLVMGLCGAWIADTAAYFVGTFLGKNKLCPEISPKKTIEGFVGGILVTGIVFVLINFICAKFLLEVSVNYFAVCVLGMLLAVIGTIGDLSASILKRQCGIKDYGNIMPGHGGLMDRFDSVIFVAPFLYAFLTVFNIYK